MIDESGRSQDDILAIYRSAINRNTTEAYEQAVTEIQNTVSREKDKFSNKLATRNVAVAGVLCSILCLLVGFLIQVKTGKKIEKITPFGVFQVDTYADLTSIIFCGCCGSGKSGTVAKNVKAFGWSLLHNVLTYGLSVGLYFL